MEGRISKCKIKFKIQKTRLKHVIQGNGDFPILIAKHVLHHKNFECCSYFSIFAPRMVVIAQLVRASDCGSEGRRFKSGWPPNPHLVGFFLSIVREAVYLNWRYPRWHILSFFPSCLSPNLFITKKCC